MVTPVTVVKSRARLMSSSIEASASTVRHQPTGITSGDEITPVGEYSSSSGPESATQWPGPTSTVTRAPLRTTDDGYHMVTYDSSRTDPIMVRVDTALPGATELIRLNAILFLLVRALTEAEEG